MAKTADKPPVRKTAKAAAFDTIEFTTPEPAAPSPPAPVMPEPAEPSDMQIPKMTEAPDLTSSPFETVILLNVRKCSACGGDHDGVILLPLTSPALDIQATHFFYCPAIGQMVYIKHME